MTLQRRAILQQAPHMPDNSNGRQTRKHPHTHTHTRTEAQDNLLKQRLYRIPLFAPPVPSGSTHVAQHPQWNSLGSCTATEQCLHACRVALHCTRKLQAQLTARYDSFSEVKTKSLFPK